jgi:tetratricopeptide (TPR) repeat protein
MGRRTKYQTFDTPQLVLNIETEQVEQFIHPEVSAVDSIIGDEKLGVIEGEVEEGKEGEGENEERKIAHEKIDLDEDCILLEKVNITEEGESNVDVTLCFQIYINGLVHNELTSQVNEYDLQYERANAYIEKVLEKSHNWLIFSMSLFLRSKNEQEKIKTRERSMIQMQTLIDQYRDEEPSLGERSRYAFTNPYPLSWNLKKQLGFAYQSIGVYLSAFELFNDLDFYEEAAQCMVVSGKITQAEKYIDKIIAKNGETPQILCLLGDLKRKDEYYERAWELSKHKNSRSMRSLGMMKFERGLIDESIECLKLALDINTLYPSTWYTLGCAYVKKEEFVKAIYAFGNVVCYDESHGEAWSNLATSYMQLEKFKEAQSCLEHAAKACRHNWKIWENLIMLYLKADNFMRVVSSIKQLIRMQKMDRVNVQLMLKVANCFLGKLSENEESIQRNTKILFDLFDKILNESPKDTGILKLYGRLVSSITPDDYEMILKIKLREVKSLLTAGWQYDLEDGKKIIKTIDELKVIMGEKYEADEEIKQFVKNTLQTIEQNKK